MMDAAFNEWLRRAWPGGPPNWDPAYMRELFEDDLRRTAQARAEREESQGIAALERRLAVVERVLGPGGRSIIGGMATAVGETIAKERERTRRTIGNEIDARGLMHDQGVWTAEKVYEVGAVVSHRGSSWCCRVENSGLKPGDGNAGWRMLHKSGSGT